VPGYFGTEPRKRYFRYPEHELRVSLAYCQGLRSPYLYLASRFQVIARGPRPGADHLASISLTYRLQGHFRTHFFHPTLQLYPATTGTSIAIDISRWYIFLCASWASLTPHHPLISRRLLQNDIPTSLHLRRPFLQPISTPAASYHDSTPLSDHFWRPSRTGPGLRLSPASRSLDFTRVYEDWVEGAARILIASLLVHSLIRRLSMTPRET
jgi:hypothetical protein